MIVLYFCTRKSKLCDNAKNNTIPTIILFGGKPVGTKLWKVN